MMLIFLSKKCNCMTNLRYVGKLFSNDMLDALGLVAGTGLDGDPAGREVVNRLRSGRGARAAVTPAAIRAASSARVANAKCRWFLATISRMRNAIFRAVSRAAACPAGVLGP